MTHSAYTDPNCACKIANQPPARDIAVSMGMMLGVQLVEGQFAVQAAFMRRLLVCNQIAVTRVHW